MVIHDALKNIAGVSKSERHVVAFRWPVAFDRLGRLGGGGGGT